MPTKFYTPGCCTEKMLFAVENNASKIMKNWFFTIQSDIFELFTIYQTGQNIGHGCNISFRHYILNLFML